MPIDARHTGSHALDDVAGSSNIRQALPRAFSSFAGDGSLGNVLRNFSRSDEANGLVPGGGFCLPPPPLAPAVMTNGRRRGEATAPRASAAEACMPTDILRVASGVVKVCV